MEECIVTILYDGQFWIALVERIDEGGRKFLGRYTFGPEPTNTDLLRFYLDIAFRIELIESLTPVRRKIRKSSNEQSRILRKSFTEFSLLQRERLGVQKKKGRQADRQEDAVRFELARKRRKEKRRGH